jgi:hypothetical protein
VIGLRAHVSNRRVLIAHGLVGVTALALVGGAALRATGAPQVPGLPLTVDAAPGAAYVVKCHVRTYTTPEGGIANTYALDRKGPFKDAIPSVNAQCQLWKTAGPGPVTLHIFKAGDHSATADIGKPASVQVW